MNKRKIKVDVVSDVVCPWCYIGKRRLEAAIRQVEGDLEVEVNFLPFELNPNLPAEGTNQKQYLGARFGGEDRYKQLTSHVAGIASQEGLRFDFSRQDVMPNTMNAHRLIQFAGAFGIQGAVKEAMMKAYFEDGIDLSSNDNLISIAVNAGVDREAAQKLLAASDDVSAIREMEKRNHQRGISGVPFFIINDKYGISGAQSSDTLVQILKEVSSEIAAAQDQSCEVDQQNC